jgi:hypothetical protein
MKCGKDIRYHIATGRLTKIICQKLKGARGGVYTLKPRQLCSELFFGENIPYCVAKVRKHLLSILGDAIVHELSNRKYIVVMVNKALEILACGQQYED